MTDIIGRTGVSEVGTAAIFPSDGAANWWRSVTRWRLSLDKRIWIYGKMGRVLLGSGAEEPPERSESKNRKWQRCGIN
jgi:hypothetical protein